MMLKKLKGSEETLVHVCPKGKGEPQVFKHDLKSYMLIYGKMVCVWYCPYCGADMDKEVEDE